MKIIIASVILVMFTGCVVQDTPYVNVGAHKTVDIGGGVKVKLNAGDMIRVIKQPYQY